MTDLKVTPASQWRRKTEIIQLPSGNVAELTKPSPTDMVLHDGNIPNGLEGIVMEAMANPGQPLDVTKANTNNVAMLNDVVNNIARAAFVNPRVVEHPNYEKGEIALSDIDPMDKFWLLAWATDQLNEKEQGQAAERFPEEPVADIPVAQAG